MVKQNFQFGGLLNPTQGGLLSNNIYMNNVANKNMMNTMMPQTGNLPMGSANQSTPLVNVPSQLNVPSFPKTPPPPLEYPEYVTREDKPQSKLERLLFGEKVGTPVEMKKKLYDAMRNLSDEELLYFQANPQAFIQAKMSQSASANIPTKRQNTEYFMSLGDGSTPSRTKDPTTQLSDEQEAYLLANSPASSPTNVANVESAERDVKFGRTITHQFIDDKLVELQMPINTTITEANLEADKKFEQKRAEELAKGNVKFENAKKNNQTIGKVINLMKQSGDISGWFTAIVPEGLAPIVIPEATDGFDLIKSVIFLGLKESLGAQFTEKEAKNLVEASYNPALSEEMNIERLYRLRAEIERVFLNKYKVLNYYNKNNTLYGFTGVDDLDDYTVERVSSIVSDLERGMYRKQDYFVGDPNDGVLIDGIAEVIEKASPAEKAFLKTFLSFDE